MKRFALLFVLAACGGKIEEGSTDPTAVGQPTPTTTSVPPSPGSPGAPTPGPTPPSAPSPTSSKTFTAEAAPGGRDHLIVFAADASADSCIRIHLASPASKSAYPNVVTPTEWGIDNITRSPGASRCGPGRQPPAAEQATDAKGTISFAPTKGVYPCSVDVHVVASFGGKPTTEPLDHDQIAVEGCK
jgi:hypothetical protein